MDPDYEQLSNDVDLISRMKQFREATDQIANILKPVDNQEFYETLCNTDKIKYNQLMSFGMNTLFWMYLRAEGIDPSTHRIKLENERLKQSMTRSQRIKDRKTIMPRLDKDVAKRFVRNGLWTPENGADNVEDAAKKNNQTTEEDWDEPSTNDRQETTGTSVTSAL